MMDKEKTSSSEESSDVESTLSRREIPDTIQSDDSE